MIKTWSFGTAKIFMTPLAALDFKPEGTPMTCSITTGQAVKVFDATQVVKEWLIDSYIKYKLTDGATVKLLKQFKNRDHRSQIKITGRLIKIKDTFVQAMLSYPKDACINDLVDMVTELNINGLSNLDYLNKSLVQRLCHESKKHY